MEPLEQAILQRIEQAVLSEDIITEAAERAIALYRQARASDSGRRERTARALQEVGREVERYVQAIGKGVDVGEIPEALARAKARREALTAELGALTGPERTPTLDREEVRKSLRQWRGRLRQAPAVARRLLRVLLPEPLVLERVPAGIRFRGQLAIGPLLIGLVPDAGVSALVPPGCHARTSRRDCLPR
jgi:hypothetical protein